MHIAEMGIEYRARDAPHHRWVRPHVALIDRFAGCTGLRPRRFASAFP
jgi:hypothetical protein